jgi:polyphenol oxidase
MLEPYQADNLAMLPGVRHGFFTRQGGLSTGLYKTLNCGAGSKDDRVTVRENRSRVAEHLGSSHGDVQTIFQVHSADVVAVDTVVDRDSLPKADALVTATRGLAIGVLTADCCPVLFADSEARVVGAAHAGWKGALGGVLEATVAAMENLGATRARITAAYGPTISQPSYEVGQEFLDTFAGQDPAFSRFFKSGGKTGKQQFDLPAFVDFRLRASSLTRVEACAPCTYRNESLFYSYRRSVHRSEADYGRQISAIVVA